MKAFASTALFGVVALNCFLGISGQALAREMRRVFAHDGVKLSVVSEAAFGLQPWFYLVAVAALAIVCLGLSLCFGHFQAAIIILAVFGGVLALIASIARSL